MHYTIMRRTGNKSSNTGNNLVVMIAREYVQKQGKTGNFGLIKPIFRGIEVILYEGFRNAFVNCKFTFYITLS